MIYVGIDVAKDKHDCFSMNSDGEILIEKLTITNNLDGFETLYNSLMNFSNSLIFWAINFSQRLREAFSTILHKVLGGKNQTHSYQMY